MLRAMALHDLDGDRRYCPSCRAYVPYLWSPQATYCVRCGALADLFSQDDLTAFRKSSGIPARGFVRLRGAARAAARSLHEGAEVGLEDGAA